MQFVLSDDTWTNKIYNARINVKYMINNNHQTCQKPLNKFIQSYNNNKHYKTWNNVLEIKQTKKISIPIISL
jgi:hypothetical protein